MRTSLNGKKSNSKELNKIYEINSSAKFETIELDYDLIKFIKSKITENKDPYYMLIYNLIVGMIFVVVYCIFYSAIPDKGASRGLQFGFWIWLLPFPQTCPDLSSF